MPRRKGPPLEEAIDTLVEKHAKMRAAAAPEEPREHLRPKFEVLALLDAYDDLMRLPLTEVPFNATDEELEQLSAADIVRLTDAYRGKQSRAYGGKSKGQRRTHYRGKPILRDQMRAAVQAMHADHPTWSFNYVCLEVAKSKDFRYKTAWPVKEACKARPAIKWPDPSRPHK